MDYLLLLQNFREWSGGIFDSFFTHITMGGEYEFGILFTALIYWIINKNYGIFMIWNLFLGLLTNQFLKVTACIYRPWILDSRIHPVKIAMQKPAVIHSLVDIQQLRQAQWEHWLKKFGKTRNGLLFF